MTTEAPVVEQVDRDAAANLMRELFAGYEPLEGDFKWSWTVQRGEDDAYPVVQAFARHRSLQRDDVLEEAAKVADEYRDPSLDNERDVNVAAASARACFDIAARIRTLRSGGGGGG